MAMDGREGWKVAQGWGLLGHEEVPGCRKNGDRGRASSD